MKVTLSSFSSFHPFQMFLINGLITCSISVELSCKSIVKVFTYIKEGIQPINLFDIAVGVHEKLIENEKVNDF